jgi:spermidine synthase
MQNTISNYIDEGKKSLEALLREKAYEDVASTLKAEGIDITQVSEEDIEALVAEKTKDMSNTLKGVAIGSVGALLLSSVLGF